MTDRRTFCAAMTAAAAGLALGALAAPASAQDYPNRPVIMVVPFPPGGSSDVVARILAESMSKELGQPVVVENRDGAGGAVGIAYVSAAEPDGYTVGVSGIGSSILLQGMGEDTGYDFTSDLDLVGVMGSLGLVIAGRQDLEQKTLTEVIEYAKANPGELAYGTSGIGTPGHLAMELLKSMAGADILHIPYRGNTPLLNDVLGGHVDLAMLTTPGSAEQIQTGAIQGYAVTSATRSDLLPDVPTVAELGYEGYAADLWNLLVVPTSTPPEAVERLSSALNKAMEDPAVVETLAQQGMKPTVTTPEEAEAFLAAETAKWQKVIDTTGAAAN